VVIPIIIIIIGLILATAILWQWWSTRPAITVRSYSINPPTIKESDVADLSIGLKNEDKKSSHDVRLVFTAHRYVSLSIGGRQLSRSDSNWMYEFTMAAGQERIEHISVKAKLEPGQTSVTYSISVVVYVDEKQSETRTQNLTVTSG
jgi:hypothetical protein